MFDPVDGRTYAISPEEFEVVRAVAEFVDTPWSDPEDVLNRAMRELVDEGAESPSDSDRANLARWVHLAMHLVR